ncbi:MAG: hypothetical protein LBU91_07210 [Bacteroidales bacterium]|nr:hypothetical protein [Bacteroidales bacterium]
MEQPCIADAKLSQFCDKVASLMQGSRNSATRLHRWCKAPAILRQGCIADARLSQFCNKVASLMQASRNFATTSKRVLH